MVAVVSFQLPSDESGLCTERERAINLTHRAVASYLSVILVVNLDADIRMEGEVGRKILKVF